MWEVQEIACCSETCMSVHKTGGICRHKHSHFPCVSGSSLVKFELLMTPGIWNGTRLISVQTDRSVESLVSLQYSQRRSGVRELSLGWNPSTAGWEGSLTETRTWSSGGGHGFRFIPYNNVFLWREAVLAWVALTVYDRRINQKLKSKGFVFIC